MKTIKYILPLFALMILAVAAQAQTAARGQNPARLQSYNALSKTAMVIHDAQGKVKAGKVYTGNLAKAVNHQRFAVRQHKAGNYVTAIHQTRFARRLAVLAIKANRGKVAASMETDSAVIKETSPPDADLETEMKAGGLDKIYVKDQEVLDTVVEEVGPNE